MITGKPHLKRIFVLLRKSAVFLVGVAIIVLGIILIPLPGPGLLVILAGLFILSLEFAWAGRHFNRAKTAHKKLRDKVRAGKKRPPKNT